MIRQFFAGFLFAFAAAGCNVASDPIDSDLSDEIDVSEGAHELSAKEGESCGGFAGITCADGLFCDFAPETSCGSGDQAGVCIAPPGACLPVMHAVCGCDGRTYGNACAAAQSLVSVLHTGACK